MSAWHETIDLSANVLNELLTSGHIGRLHFGMSKIEVEDLLGPPEDTGGTSRNNRRPSIYRYGALEIFFGGADRNAATSVQIRCLHGTEIACLLVERTDEVQTLTSKVSLNLSRFYLEQNGIDFREVNSRPGLTHRLILTQSAVELIFDDDNNLYSINAALPHSH